MRGILVCLPMGYSPWPGRPKGAATGSPSVCPTGHSLGHSSSSCDARCCTHSCVIECSGCSCVLDNFFFVNLRFIIIIFLEQLQIYNKIEKKVQRIPTQPCKASSLTNITHQNGTYFTRDEPTWTCHNYPKSIVYVEVHSWWCTFCGFAQMYTDTYPS